MGLGSRVGVRGRVVVGGGVGVRGLARVRDRV